MGYIGVYSLLTGTLQAYGAVLGQAPGMCCAGHIGHGHIGYGQISWAIVSNNRGILGIIQEYIGNYIGNYIGIIGNRIENYL